MACHRQHAALTTFCALSCQIACGHSAERLQCFWPVVPSEALLSCSAWQVGGLAILRHAKCAVTAAGADPVALALHRRQRLRCLWGLRRATWRTTACTARCTRAEQRSRVCRCWHARATPTWPTTTGRDGCRVNEWLAHVFSAAMVHDSLYKPECGKGEKVVCLKLAHRYESCTDLI